MPAELTAALPDRRAGQSSGRIRAHRIELPASVSDQPAWLVTDNDQLCLFVPDTEGFGSTCQTAADALAGRLMLTLVGGGVQRVVGVAADGISMVHIMGADNTGFQTAVTNNVYAFRTTGANTIAVGGLLSSIPNPTDPPGTPGPA
jgi:hypothetical protein